MLVTVLRVTTMTMTFKITFAHHVAIANAIVATLQWRQTSQGIHAMIAEKTSYVTIAIKLQMNAETATESPTRST